MHMYTPAELRRAEVGAQRRLLLEGEELPKHVENKPDMTGRSGPLIGTSRSLGGSPGYPLAL